MKMNVLLVRPPLHELSICFGFLESYSLEVLSTSIQNDDNMSKYVEVKIIDLHIEPLINLSNILRLKNIDVVGITGLTIDQRKIIELAILTKKYHQRHL